MPPSKEHEDAIHIIKEELKIEFGLDDNNFRDYKPVKGAIPDIWFRHPYMNGIVIGQR